MTYFLSLQRGSHPAVLCAPPSIVNVGCSQSSTPKSATIARTLHLAEHERGREIVDIATLSLAGGMACSLSTRIFYKHLAELLSNNGTTHTVQPVSTFSLLL